MKITDVYSSKKELELPQNWTVEDSEYEGRIEFKMNNTNNHILINDWGDEGYIVQPMVENNNDNTGFTASSDTSQQDTFNTLEGAIKYAIRATKNWDKMNPD